jgi:hypothetical protein
VPEAASQKASAEAPARATTPQETACIADELRELQQQLARQLQLIWTAQRELERSQKEAEPDKDPPTIYRRRDLTTDRGREAALTLWAHGMTAAQIAKCFDYAEPAGAACVTAAIVLCLAEYSSDGPWNITDPAGREMALMVLDKGGAPRTVTATPVPVTVAAPRQRPAQKRKLKRATSPVTVTAAYAPETLKTAEGRAKATELWVDGHTLKHIGFVFGYRVTATYVVWQAINTFLVRDCKLSVAEAKAKGEQRVKLARAALSQFRSH